MLKFKMLQEKNRIIIELKFRSNNSCWKNKKVKEIQDDQSQLVKFRST